MSSAPKRKTTAAEYLLAERASSTRNVFYRGEIYAMAGASREHSRIALNLGSALNQLFLQRPCEAFVSDMRVKNGRTGSYFYPDVVATCKELKFDDDKKDTLINPQVIIEVLSKTTEKFDRGLKFEDYQRLESLKEYVLVSQDRLHVERFTRQTESTWEYWSSNDPDDTLVLTSIDCEVQLSDIYSKVEFPPPEESMKTGA
jgi:Uma2 family endonuclease